MDDDTKLQAMHQLQMLEQEWLADEAAQAEYRKHLAATYGEKHEPQQSD